MYTFTMYLPTYVHYIHVAEDYFLFNLYSSFRTKRSQGSDFHILVNIQVNLSRFQFPVETGKKN